MKTFSFNGEPVDIQTTLLSPELQGANIVPIRFLRWTGEENGIVIDKGGRIDIDVEEIATPIIYKTEVHATDFLVSSRDIKDGPEEAFAEALAETEKVEPKSLDLIARSSLRALEHALKEIKKLRSEVDQLKKKVK